MRIRAPTCGCGQAAPAGLFFRHRVPTEESGPSMAPEFWRNLDGLIGRAPRMIELAIPQRRRSIGAFEVGRVLPSPRRRMLGPFVFFDHMGPMDLAPGIPRSVDVRPHPHIGLATVTYLFDG